jgi:glycosyltransferase involved in cell wall biosynthesis
MVEYTVVIPVFNEETAVKETVDKVVEVMRAAYSFEIIAVNDCSTDKSKETLEELTKTYPCLRVISHEKNKGYGASLRTGIKKANGEWIIITDADGTYPFEKVKDMIPLTNDYDMVIGARTGAEVHIPFMRKPAKWLLKRVAEGITHQKIPDINSGLRIFRKELAFKFWRLFPNGFSFTSTITIASLVNEYDVKWIPIDYYKRKGKSTIKPIKDFANFILLIIKSAFYFAPLRMFIPISAFLFIVGLTKAIIDYITSLSLYGVHSVGIASITTILFSLIVFLIGILADLFNRRQPR